MPYSLDKETGVLAFDDPRDQRVFEEEVLLDPSVQLGRRGDKIGCRTMRSVYALEGLEKPMVVKTFSSGLGLLPPGERERILKHRRSILLKCAANWVVLKRVGLSVVPFLQINLQEVLLYCSDLRFGLQAEDEEAYLAFSSNDYHGKPDLREYFESHTIQNLETIMRQLRDVADQVSEAGLVFSNADPYSFLIRKNDELGEVALGDLKYIWPVRDVSLAADRKVLDVNVGCARDSLSVLEPLMGQRRYAIRELFDALDQ